MRVLMAAMRILTAATLFCVAEAIDNGVGRTPPLGFNPWNCFGISAKGTCKLVNPSLPPPGCHGFNESVILDVARAIVSTGLRDAGYEYVNLDCGWTTGFRHPNGTLIEDRHKFPRGIKGLGEALHAMGLKFGIYLDAGAQQCCSKIHHGANDGSLGHEEQDAALVASYGVDLLKYDSCGSVASSYPKMRDALNATNREIYYSIHGPKGAAAVPIANCWRTTADISNDWSSMMQRAIINDGFQQYAQPGGFNDPDMLEVGNFYGPLNEAESRTQMSLWSMMKAPLLIGTDLTILSRAFIEILGNPEVIAVNQDKLGVQGSLKTEPNATGLVWSGPLEGGDVVVALVNTNKETAEEIRFDLKLVVEDSPTEPETWSVRNLWAREDAGHVTNHVSFKVNPHDTVMLRLSKMKA